MPLKFIQKLLESKPNNLNNIPQKLSSHGSRGKFEEYAPSPGHVRKKKKKKLKDEPFKICTNTFETL